MATGTHEPSLTARMQAVRLTSSSKSVAVGQRRKAGWPLWQYAAAVIMATGVLGIGFAMFRRPVASSNLIPPASEVASKPVSETANPASGVSSTPAAGASQVQNESVKQE